jgi:hypothetical protein
MSLSKNTFRFDVARKADSGETPTALLAAGFNPNGYEPLAKRTHKTAIHLKQIKHIRRDGR